MWLLYKEDSRIGLSWVKLMFGFSSETVVNICPFVEQELYGLQDMRGVIRELKDNYLLHNNEH